MSCVKRFLNVGSNIEQRVTKATLRTHPIAAEKTAPAPNAFNLVSLVANDRIAISTKPSVPAYTFRANRVGSDGEPTPGPGEYDVPYGSGAKDMPTPESRLRIPLRKGALPRAEVVTPGPADYFTASNKRTFVKKSVKPAKRLEQQRRFVFTTPAPDAYRIPALIGATQGGDKKSAPAFSIRERLPSRSPDERPGPGDYENRYFALSQEPRFTMGYRRERSTDILPGPGKYYPERAAFARKSIPALSLGIRHTKYRGQYTEDD